MLFPKWFWFNIYEISAWSRAILVPLSIAYAKKPFKKIPAERGIDELFPAGQQHTSMHLKWDAKLISWRNFFLVLDRLTHWMERVHVRPLRSIALRAAEKWMLERFEMSDGLGAIYPAMMNAIIALRCLGYSVDDPQFIRAMDEFEALGIEEAILLCAVGPARHDEVLHTLRLFGEQVIPHFEGRRLRPPVSSPKPSLSAL